MQKITPFFWYDDKAEEAMNLYVSLFKNSKVIRVTRYGDTGPGPKGSVMTAEFELNGGPHFKFTEAISFVVPCDTQAEIDELWEKLSAGGRKDQCGWLKDKYGLSWQITPAILGELVGTVPVKGNAVMKTLMQMTKLDIATLQEAHDKA